MNTCRYSSSYHFKIHLTSTYRYYKWIYISVRTKSVTILVVSTLYPGGSPCKVEQNLQAGMCHSAHLCISEYISAQTVKQQKAGWNQVDFLATIHLVLPPSLQPSFCCFCLVWEAVNSFKSYAKWRQRRKVGRMAPGCLQAMLILKDQHFPQQIRKSNERTKFVTTKSSI